MSFDSHMQKLFIKIIHTADGTCTHNFSSVRFTFTAQQQYVSRITGGISGQVQEGKRECRLKRPD